MRLSPRLRNRLQVWSLRATRQIALRLGNEFPFYYVSEYPKSGGTWVAQMLADYLQVPFPQHYCLPIAHEAVLHNHWRYDPRLAPRTVYIMRDGRDVCVSAFFHLRRVAGKPTLTTEQVRNVMPSFVDWWATRPMGGAGVTWGRHIVEWTEQKPAACLLRYKYVKEYPRVEILNAAAHVTDRESDNAKAAATALKFSFERQTGRDPGDEDQTSPLRKGIVGDWRNYFNYEAAKRFDRHFGATLVRLAYEKDHEWVWDTIDQGGEQE